MLQPAKTRMAESCRIHQSRFYPKDVATALGHPTLQNDSPRAPAEGQHCLRVGQWLPWSVAPWKWKQLLSLIGFFPGYCLPSLLGRIDEYIYIYVYLYMLYIQMQTIDRCRLQMQTIDVDSQYRLSIQAIDIDSQYRLSIQTIDIDYRYRLQIRLQIYSRLSIQTIDIDQRYRPEIQTIESDIRRYRKDMNIDIHIDVDMPESYLIFDLHYSHSSLETERSLQFTAVWRAYKPRLW